MLIIWQTDLLIYITTPIRRVEFMFWNLHPPPPPQIWCMMLAPDVHPAWPSVTHLRLCRHTPHSTLPPGAAGRRPSPEDAPQKQSPWRSKKNQEISRVLMKNQSTKQSHVELWIPNLRFLRTLGRTGKMPCDNWICHQEWRGRSSGPSPLSGGGWRWACPESDTGFQGPTLLSGHPNHLGVGAVWGLTGGCSNMKILEVFLVASLFSWNSLKVHREAYLAEK